MALDNAINRGQAQAGALADFFGGEKGLEHPLQDFGIHAAPLVGHPEQCVASPLDLIGFAFEIGMAGGAGLDKDIAAFGHRVGCIDVQVPEHLLHLVAVGLDQRQIRHQVAVNAHVALRHCKCFRSSLDQVIDIDPVQLIFTASGKPQQLAGELRGAGNNGLDVGCFLGQLAFRIDIQIDQGNVALDAHQQVIEVVGDPSREFPDGLQFLNLLQMLLQALAFLLCLNPLTDIADDSPESRCAAIFITDGGGR